MNMHQKRLAVKRRLPLIIEDDFTPTYEGKPVFEEFHTGSPYRNDY